MGLVWTDHLSVGNEIIDSDHKILITMVNGIEYMLKKMDCFAMPQAFDQAEHWLRVHFVNEEMVAMAVGFPFAGNQQEHEKLLDTFCMMRDEIVQMDGKCIEKKARYYSDFLSEWLIEHFLMEDMQMKPKLQTCQYDFKPAGWHPELAQMKVNRQKAERIVNKFKVAS